MGGTPIKPVSCADYTTAEAIDDTIFRYVDEGLIPEAEEMMAYSWFWFGLWIWDENVHSYMTAIEAVAECGISNGVEDATYNKEWLDTTFRDAEGGYCRNIWGYT